MTIIKDLKWTNENKICSKPFSVSRFHGEAVLFTVFKPFHSSVRFRQVIALKTVFHRNPNCIQESGYCPLNINQVCIYS